MRRTLASFAASAMALSGLALVTLTAPPASAATGPYGGTAFVDLVHLEAVTIPGTTTVADVSVAPADAQVASAGLAAPNAGKNSFSRAANLDVDVLSGTIPLTGLIVESSQVALPTNAAPTVNELLNVDAAPLATVLLARATAHSRWSSSGCVPPGTPISLAQSEVTDPRVLTGQADIGEALVALANSQGSTVYTKSTVGLINVAGQTTKGLQSIAHTQLTAVTLFKGSPNEFTINVLAPPVITATVTGQPGGAKVEYSEPILQIVQGGTILGELNAVDINQQIAIPGGILDLRIGQLDKTESADGTTATGSASLLTLELLGTGLPIEVVSPLSIAAGTVTASVPVGGVECPAGDNPLRDAHKDLSAADVSPGSTFTYTVDVPNRGACTLTNVKVVDEVTGPAGSTIVSTAPAASTTEGLKMTWNDIGPIAPNETKTLFIVVQVPDNAPTGAVYRNTMTVTGMCDGSPAEKTDTVNGPTVSAKPSGPCDLSDSNKAASHTEVMQGQSFNYYIHLFNSGGQPCTGITVTDTLIDNVDFVSCSDGCTTAGKTLTWTIPTLEADHSKTLVVTVKASGTAPVGTKLPNSAVAKPASGAQGNVSTPGPAISTRSVLAGPNPARRSGQLPATGGGQLAAILGLGLLGASALAFRLRRKVTA